jgi:hypothetical protein
MPKAEMQTLVSEYISFPITSQAFVIYQFVTVGWGNPARDNPASGKS